MKNAAELKQNSESTCKLCGGTKWILLTVMTEEDLHYTFSGHRINKGAEYAYPCPNCGQEVRLGGTGIPNKYYNQGYETDKFWEVYRDDCLQTKRIIENFIDKTDSWNYGLYLWSNQRGTGKTKLSCALLTSIRIKHDLSVRFVSVPEYLYNLRRSFGDKGGASGKITKDLIDCDLLCLDDLGAEKRSEWTDQEMFYLLDTRYTRGRKTIITSNFDLENLQEDARLSDRIGEICIELHMPEQSIRTQEAYKKQSTFLSNILKEG